METKALKKLLAGIGIVGLLAAGGCTASSGGSS